MKGRTKGIILCLLMILSPLSACQSRPVSGETEAEPTAAVAPAPTDTPEPSEAPEAPKEEPQISWAKAFRTNSLPDGTVSPDVIAFYTVDSEGAGVVANVPKEEVFAFQPERLPRSRSLEQYVPDKLQTLLPVLDYALANGYSRFSMPTTDFCYSDINDCQKILDRIFRIDGGGLNSLDVQSFPLEDGRTLTYVLLTISGLSSAEKLLQYREALAAARSVADSVPEDLSDFETALYLYRYLTDNVVYDDDEYYLNGHELLLYDALVKHETVCAGYTEALYYLYNLAGIDCVVIGGYISDPEPRGSHIWNAAKIDGQYYQFDATWDAGLPVANFEFFGVSDDYMMTHHTKYVDTLDREIAPPCPASLFPDADLDYAAISASEALSSAYYYCLFLSLRESDPMQIMTVFGLPEGSWEEWPADGGWTETDIPCMLFSYGLSTIMDASAAERFVDGYFENRDGLLAFQTPSEGLSGLRLCRLTENADGSALAECYSLDEAGNFIPCELSFRFKDGRVSSVSRK